jgi:hypothetical protein
MRPLPWCVRFVKTQYGEGWLKITVRLVIFPALIPK